jgi:hypothetical protein
MKSPVYVHLPHHEKFMKYILYIHYMKNERFRKLRNKLYYQCIFHFASVQKSFPWKFPDRTNMQQIIAVNSSSRTTSFSTFEVELAIRHHQKVQMQVHIANSNSKTSNCQCSLFSIKNPNFLHTQKARRPN